MYRRYNGPGIFCTTNVRADGAILHLLQNTSEMREEISNASEIRELPFHFGLITFEFHLGENEN